MKSGSIIKTPEKLSGGKKREQGGWDSAGCGGEGEAEAVGQGVNGDRGQSLHSQ